MEYRAVLRPLVGIWIILLFGVNVIMGQSIVFLPQEGDRTVCMDHKQSLLVENPGPEITSPVYITFLLPCGMIYQPGSVSGAQEETITDLQNPVFSLAGLPAGASLTIRIGVTVTCEALTCLNQGYQYKTTARWLWMESILRPISLVL